MSNLKKNLISYLKVFLITLVLVHVIVFAIIWHVAYIEYSIAVGNIERIEINEDESKIRALLEEEKENPDDYIINIKLGILYEKQENFSLADMQYKKALMKSPRNDFALYRYSLFCIKTHRYIEAINLVENITDTPSKGVIGKKLAIYEKIAEELEKSGDYQNSTKIYTLAYRYAKILSGSKKDEILNKLEESYIYLADEDIARNNYEQAKLNLEALLKLKESSLAKYKLALIYKPFNPEKSAEYITEIFEKNPRIVNVEIYYNILGDLSEKYEKIGQHTEAKYYKHKQNRIKKYIENNLIYSEDLVISNPTIARVNNRLIKRSLNFDIATNSSLKIGTVYLKLDIEYPNNKKETIYTNIEFDRNRTKQLKSVNVLLKQKGSVVAINKLEYAKVIIYARKNLKYDWTYIREFNTKY